METVVCGLCGCDYAQVVLRQQDLLHRVSTEEFTIVRCSGCSLCYLNPRPTVDEIGIYYPRAYFSGVPVKRPTALEQSWKRVSERIKRWIMEDFYGYPASGRPSRFPRLRKCLLWPEKVRRVLRGRNIIPWVGEGRLLDVGSGPGGNLEVLQRQGWDVYGIDVSEEAALQARARVGERIHVGTLDTAPFKEEWFDVVLFSHSLEHLFSPIEELSRVHRFLQRGGLVIITVPNAASLEARLFGSWWVPWDPPRHLYHFEPATLGRLLERAGFQVTTCRTGVGSLYFMASLERVWDHKFGKALPARRLIEKVIAIPFCLVSGHMGYGTEITVHAVKKGRDSGSAEALNPHEQV